MILGLLGVPRREAVECIIRVGSARRAIEDLYPFLAEVTVDTARNEATTATLTFESRRDEQGSWLIQDDGRLVPWAPIVIEAAFGNQIEEVMRGYIRRIHADYPEDAGNTIVKVECQDDSLVLDREHIRMVWGGDVPTTDTLILTTILGKYGLTADPASGRGQTGLVINQDGTDIEFLQRRAAANGYDLLFHNGIVYFGPMRLDADSQATIMVYAGAETSACRFAVHDDGHQADRVTFDRAQTSGSDPLSETLEPDLPVLGTEPATGAGGGLPVFAWRLSRQGEMGEDEWRARAQRRANELSLRVRGEGELDGSLYGHVLRSGAPVGVDGIGDRYGGIWFVDSVQHHFNNAGYRQSFKLLRNAYGDNLGSGVGSVLASVLGG